MSVLAYVPTLKYLDYVPISEGESRTATEQYVRCAVAHFKLKLLGNWNVNGWELIAVTASLRSLRQWTLSLTTSYYQKPLKRSKPHVRWHNIPPIVF
jgi:hypothetical protein